MLRPCPAIVRQFHPFDETDGGAGLVVGDDAGGADSTARKGEVLGSDAAGGCKGIKCRGLVPSRAGVGGTVGRRLVSKEGEDSVLEDGPADASTVLVEALRILDRVTCAGPSLVGVEAGPVQSEEGATVNLVGAALGGDHRLSAAEAAVFSVIVVGHDADVGDGIFGRRNDGGSTPDRADGADTVDRNAIASILLTVGVGLRTVLRGRCAG